MRCGKDYNDLLTKAGKNPIAFRLTSVEKVVNPVLEHRFALRHMAMKERADNKCSAEELRERVAFHGERCALQCLSLTAALAGTHPLNLVKICSKGLLRVGHEFNPSKRVDEGYFGVPEHGVCELSFVSADAHITFPAQTCLVTCVAVSACSLCW